MEMENELSFEQEMAAAYGKGANESAEGTEGPEEREPGAEETDTEVVTGTNEAGSEETKATETQEQTEEQTEQRGGEEKGTAQSHEENAKYKAIRQKAEEDAGKKMQAALEKEVDEFYRQQYAGKKNPETGAEILGKADALAYEQATAKAGQNAQAEQLRKELLDLGMSEAAANALVKPLQGGRESETEKELQEVKRGQELAEFSRKIDSEIEELNRKHPECGIKGPRDIGSNAALLEEIGQRADKNLVKAWESLHYEELIEKERAAARQTAINQARGGSHVKMANSANADGADVSITPEEMEVWRAMGYSQDDAVAYYTKQK